MSPLARSVGLLATRLSLLVPLADCSAFFPHPSVAAAANSTSINERILRKRMEEGPFLEFGFQAGEFATVRATRSRRMGNGSAG